MGVTTWIGDQFARPSGTGGEAAAFLMSRMNRCQYQSVKQGFSRVRAGNLLDIGFGSGRLTGELSRERPDCILYGVELAPDMLKSAKRRNARQIESGRMFLRLGDAAALPYRDRYFRGVYTVNTVYFWQDPQRCLREIYRVLEPGGIFLNAFYHRDFLERMQGATRSYRKYTPEELEELTRQAGFSGVSVRELKRKKAYCLEAKRTG